VTHCYVATDKKTGNSKGFAFIAFDSPEAVEAAVAKSRVMEINNRKLEIRPKEEDVNRSSRGMRNTPGNIIYVGNLDFTCQRSEMIKLLSNFGQLINVRMPLDNATGQYRG
jgi:nucleolin